MCCPGFTVRDHLLSVSPLSSDPADTDTSQPTWQSRSVALSCTCALVHTMQFCITHWSSRVTLSITTELITCIGVTYRWEDSWEILQGNYMMSDLDMIAYCTALAYNGLFNATLVTNRTVGSNDAASANRWSRPNGNRLVYNIVILWERVLCDVGTISSNHIVRFAIPLHACHKHTDTWVRLRSVERTMKPKQLVADRQQVKHKW